MYEKFIMLHFLINQTYFLGQDNEKMQFSSNIFHFDETSCLKFVVSSMTKSKAKSKS